MFKSWWFSQMFYHYMVWNERLHQRDVMQKKKSEKVNSESRIMNKIKKTNDLGAQVASSALSPRIK